MYIKTAKVHFLLSRSEGADLGSCSISYPSICPFHRIFYGPLKRRSCGTVDASDRLKYVKIPAFDLRVLFNGNMANAAPHNSATRYNVKSRASYETTTTTPLII